MAPRVQSGDTVYLYHSADTAYSYYRSRMRVPDAQVVMGSRSDEVDRALEKDVDRIARQPRVWLVFSHVWRTRDGDEMHQLLRLLDQRRGRRLESYSATGAAVYLYDLSDVSDPSAGQ